MIAHWLAVLVDALLAPVLIAILVLLLATLLHLGGFLREAAARWLRRGPAAGRCFVASALAAGGDRQHVAADVQARMLHGLERLSLGIRLGPVLGLAGTLIPLGPSLVAFGKGDLDALANQLALAFHATVVGLLIGGLCFAMQLTRRRWYRLDLLEITAWARQAG